MFFEPIEYRYRPGALDRIMREQGARDDAELAWMIGVKPEDIPALRRGRPVTAAYALKISVALGDAKHVNSFFQHADSVDIAA